MPDKILEYHKSTVHDRQKIMGRSMIPGLQSVPFKLYEGTPVFHLHHELEYPEVALDAALIGTQASMVTNMPKSLAGILNLTAGFTRIQMHDERLLFHYRTVPSAGALYPCELYVGLQDVSGMTDGLYHYCPLEHRLSHLRTGRVYENRQLDQPVIRFYVSTIFHRSAWKYGERAYRYCLLDAGHMIENLVTSARIHGLPACLNYDFSDRRINRFLALDTEHEACLAVVDGMGCTPELKENDQAALTSDTLSRFSKTNPRAVVTPAVLDAHETTSSFARCPRGRELPDVDTTPLRQPHIPASTSATILRRKSSRNFVTRTARQHDMEDVLSLLSRDAAPDCTRVLQTGFHAAPSSGLPVGFHRLNRRSNSFHQLKEGELGQRIARACLDQGWLERAATHVTFSADLESLTRSCGPRVYRYAHLEAGRLAQRVYLAATAKQMGACGIGAFFDAEANAALGFSGNDTLLYLIATGPIKR